MTRSLHPKKEVEAALRHAETHGWRVTVGGAHAWGKIYCPRRHDECRCGEFCITSVWSTPRNPAIMRAPCGAWSTTAPRTAADAPRAEEQRWNTSSP